MYDPYIISQFTKLSDRSEYTTPPDPSQIAVLIGCTLFGIYFVYGMLNFLTNRWFAEPQSRTKIAEQQLRVQTKNDNILMSKTSSSNKNHSHDPDTNHSIKTYNNNENPSYNKEPTLQSLVLYTEPNFKGKCKILSLGQTESLCVNAKFKYQSMFAISPNMAPYIQCIRNSQINFSLQINDRIANIPQYCCTLRDFKFNDSWNISTAIPYTSELDSVQLDDDGPFATS